MTEKGPRQLTGVLDNLGSIRGLIGAPMPAMGSRMLARMG